MSFVVSCRLANVGCAGFDSLVQLSMVVVCYWLSDVGCQVLTVDCRVSMLVVVVYSWSRDVGCRVPVGDYRMGVGYRSHFQLGMPNSDSCTLKLCINQPINVAA